MRPRVALALAGALSLAGSGLARAGARPVSEPRPGDPADTPADAPADAPADTLRLRLEVPPRVTAGAPVPITLRVENVAGRPLELYLRGRAPTFDVVVTRDDGGGTVVWQRLAGAVVPAIVRLETLAAGAALELRATWDQRGAGGAPVAPGRYAARALLLTDGPAPLGSPAVPLEIVPR